MESFGEKAAQAEFESKFDKKQRARDRVKFRAVVRGKIEFIGFIRGRDDELYLKLLNRLMFLDKTVKARPVIVTPATHDSVVAQAIWLLIGDGGNPQATAFAMEEYGLLTAFHTVEHLSKQGEVMYAARPGYDDQLHPITVLKYDEVRDVAQLPICGSSGWMVALVWAVKGDDYPAAVR